MTDPGLECLLRERNRLNRELLLKNDQITTLIHDLEISAKLPTESKDVQPDFD